jgi:hypothetical protein
LRARRASGGREGELVQRATRLRKDAALLLPKLTDECPTARFDRLKASLEAVRENKDEERRLEGVGRFEDPLVRAYAGLLKFYLDPELPGVLVARYPFGEVSFAPLGRAPREAQIAVQQGDDPERLLLGYLDWARKGFHFFATDRILFCTGPSPAPPPDFLHELLRELPYRLEKTADGHAYACTHLRAKEPVAFVEVGWTGYVAFRVCRRCAKADEQLLSAVTRRVAVPKPERMFPVEIRLNVDCRAGEACRHARLPEPSRALRKGYLFGRLSDAEALDAYRKECVERLESDRTPRFVAAGVCFGSDRAAFIEALGPTREERTALAEVLPDVQGHFEIAEPTASQALERLWHDHAGPIVAAIVPDRERAEALVRDARASPGRVSELLHRAARETRERELLGQLPQYSSLVPEARLADDVARSFRTGGAAAAEKLLVRSLPREGKERGIAYGLLTALGRASAHDWQFTPTEQEFGRSLAERATALLRVEPAAYDAALGGLLGAAGVTDWGVRSPTS